MTQSLPLVVDLDGALTFTDTLDEGVVRAICRRPLAALSAVFALAKGRAAFKHRIAQAAACDFDTLPLRAELVAWLRGQSRSGRGVHLVTGADQGIADEDVLYIRPVWRPIMTVIACIPERTFKRLRL